MQSDKLRWWSVYHEPEHEFVGRIQLYINYSTIVDENSHLKVHLKSYPLLSLRNTCSIYCFMCACFMMFCEGYKLYMKD